MKKFKKPASILLVMVLLLGALAACGGDPADPQSTTPVDEYVYVPTYVKLDTDAQINYVNGSTYYDGKVYFLANVKDGTVTVGPDGQITNGGAASGSDIPAAPLSASATDLAMAVAEPLPGGDSGDGSYTYDTYRDGLFSVNQDGSGLEELVNYKPRTADSEDGYSGVNGMTVGTDGSIWILDYVSVNNFDLPADFDPNTQNKWDYYVDSTESYSVRKLDQTGAEVASLDLSKLQEGQDYFYVRSMAVDGAGNFYVISGNFLYVLDAEGSILFKLGSENDSVNNIVTLGDGSVAATGWDNTTGAQYFKRVDVAKKDFGESMSAPVNAWNYYMGSGDYDLYYNTDLSFFGYDLDTGESTKLLTWINCDVDSNSLSSINPLPDGSILCLSSTYDDAAGTQSFELVTLTKTPARDVTQKTTLTYACMYLDWNVRSQILKFNRNNPNYRIEVQDYSEYNTDQDYTAGLTKLTTEIISGKVPDLLAVSNLPMRQYAAKGLLEDLWPYIEADSELGGREGVVQPVFNALSQDGKLYQLSSSFTVYTVLGASSVVGDTPGWTLDEMYAALDTMPEGCEIFSMGATKDQILSQCCAMGLDSYVNWETGECSFDTPEFKKMLEFANTFPLEFDWSNIDWEAGDYEDDYSRIPAGKQMLVQFYASDFQNYQVYKAVYGGDVTFIGFPSESRNGNAFQLNDGIAMSSKCANKDGAWEFMRTIMTEDYQTNNGWGFPTNKAAFDAKVKEACTPQYYTDENGNQVEQSQGSWWVGNGNEPMEIYALTQAEADQFLSLIDSTNRVYSYDESIMAIVNEEVAAYFNGQATVDNVAKNIQSRVSLYVNEQK